MACVPKLPAAVCSCRRCSKEIEDCAAARVEVRAAAEARRVSLVKQWEEAVPRARQAYLDELNRERLTTQITTSAEAVAIRAYCDRLDEVLQRTEDHDQTVQQREWVAWARAEADRIDPLLQPEALAYRVPEEISPSELDRFMPKGMSAWRPPN